MITENKDVDWNLLFVFYNVASAGSFKRAGDKLGIAHTTTSRQVAMLENQLGCRLLTREPTGVHLTPDGYRILSYVSQISETITEMMAQLATARHHLSGKIRISTTEGLGIYWLIPNFEPFAAAYPALDVSWRLINVSWPRLREECDIQVRWDLPDDPSTICRRIGSVRFGFFATPDYATRIGMPCNEEDLANHKILHMRGYEINTSHKFDRYLDLIKTYPPSMVTNNSASVLPMIAKNDFITFLPSYTDNYLGVELVKASLELNILADIFVCWDAALRDDIVARTVVGEIVRIFNTAKGRWLSD